MNQKPLRTRILSLALSVAMVFTSFPITAFATEGDTPTQAPSNILTITRTITAFDELGEGFKKPVIFDGYTYTRNVELNTAFEELKLPTELSVTVEKTTTTTTPPASSEQTSSEPISSEPISSVPISSVPPSSVPTSSEPVSSVPTSSEPTSSVSAPAEKPSVVTPPVDEPKQESNTVTETIKEVIPVTWKGDKEYTPAENCMVVYTAVLPEGYALADSAKLPTINVMVGRQARAAGDTFIRLVTGETYYIDLSSIAGTITNGVSNKIGTINTALPDTSLHYVPFTYVEKITAYRLDNNDYDIATTEARANEILNDGYSEDYALLVGDYNISHTISWRELWDNSLTYGKEFNDFGRLHSLSVGSETPGTPVSNEWDRVLQKSPNYIKNWKGISSWGQDTTTTEPNTRTLRGGSSSANWANADIYSSQPDIGFRPAISDWHTSLSKVVLELNGGSFDSNGSEEGGVVTSLNAVSTGYYGLIAPSATGLISPAGKCLGGWNTQADGKGTSFAVGASVPSWRSEKTLYAQWVPKTVDTVNKIIYAGGQPLLVVSGATPGNSTIYIDTNKNGAVDAGEKSLSTEGIIDAPSDNSDLSAYTIYGGKKDEVVTGNTFITLAGGKLKAVYGGGKDAVATVSGTKTVQVQGKPIVTMGIDLASLTNEMVLVCGALKGVVGAIQLIPPTNATAGKIMAKATIDTNKPYVNAAKFSIANSELVLDKKASTVILSGALDATYSGTNITINTQHFETGTARYGKEWIGVLLPAAGYKLPDDVSITIGGTAAAKGSDYSYNSITGEIKIEVVKGNIAVTADGAPIKYTINYNANGGLVNGKDSKILTVNYGDTITFPKATRKAGSKWRFLGWAYKPDAVTADFAGGATTINALSNIDTAQITLYAVWQSSDSSLPTSLQNGSFEVPVNKIFSNMYDYTKPNNIKWLTTASDKKIELGSPSKGLNAAYDAYGTRNASEGLQFAELNATRVAALYQMVATEPSSTLYWGLDHRARSKKEAETMEVWIGSSTEVNEAINAYKADGNQVSIKTQAVFAKHPTLQRTKDITHNWSAWHPVDGTYNVPTGQTETMFAFVSIAKPASNSCGNLLDNVFFSTVKPLARREITIRAGVGGTVRVSDASGFTTVDSSTPYNKSLELGDMLQATVMANSGYSFNGGYVDGKYYTKEALLTDFSNLRLTMGVTTPNEITILFAKDSIISLIPNGGIYPDGEKTLVADVNDLGNNAYTLGAPSREGYAFTGWLVAGTSTTLAAADVIKYLTSEDDGTTTLACGGKASVPTEQGMILIAQWTEAPPALVTTTLTLESNGGRYGEEISYGGDITFLDWQTLYELDASYGGGNALELKAPVRDGYVFINWKDVSHTYPTDLAVDDKIEYTIENGTAELTVGNNTKTDAPETLDLTAQWEKLPDAPVITTQPANKALIYGYTADNTLSLSVNTSAGDTVSYQWYTSTTNSNTGGTIISGANSSSYTVPEKKVVGNYYYYCIITATRLNRTVTTTSNAATVAVGKATLTASYAGESITFGETPALTIAVTGFVNGETANNAANYTAPTIGAVIPTDVGNHTLTPSGGSADNYDFTYTAGTLAIAAGNITSDVTAVGYTDVYDGAAHGITVTLSGKATGATIKYGNSATNCTNAELTYIDAGSYLVYYKVSKNGYTEVVGSAMVNISKKPVSIDKVTVNDKTYDGDTSTTGGNILIKNVVSNENVTASGSVTFADKNVGDNKAVDVTGITLSGADEKNYTIVADASNVVTTAKITPKSVTINWQNTDSKIYDGQPSKVTASVASGLLGGDVCNVTVTDGDKTNAGNHTATATADNANYSISNNTTPYTIGKATLTATYEDESIIYKDTTPALEVKVTGFVNGESALTATAYTAPTVVFPTVDSTHVGTHTLTPIGGSATNYDFTYVSGVLNILARNFDMVSIKDYLGDYDTQPHSATLVNSDPSSLGVTVKYYSNAACTEGETNVAPTRTDAGITTVYYKVSANGFNAYIGKANITINKKKVTPSIDTVNDKTYDGNTTATGTIKLTGVITADIADVTASGNMQFTDKNAGINKSVTVTGIAPSGTKGGNYELTATVLNAATTAKITQKAITLVWSGHTALNYTGTAQNVTAAIQSGDVEAGDTVNLTVTGGNKTAVGTNYIATAAIDNSNYSLANNTQSYDIGKAMLIAKFADESIVYGNFPTLAVTVTGFVNGETALTATAYTAPIISTAQISTDVGTHTITVTGGAAENYSFTLQDGTLTITAADMGGEVTSSGYNATYDGTAHGITVNIPVGATLKYYSDAALTTEISGGLEKITNVADSPKTVYYKVTRANYADVKGKEIITITRKTLTPALSTVDSKTYDGNTSTSGGVLTLSGIVGSEAVTASGTVTFADKNAGKNKKANVSGITLGGIAKDNYTLSVMKLDNVTTAAEIWQKEVTLSWSGDKNLVYDSKSKNVTAAAGALVTGDSCAVTVSGGTETLPGAYTATATALSDTNYKLPTTVTNSYTIADATFAVTATPYEGLYDNMTHRGVTLTGTLATDIISYSTDNGKTWTSSAVQVGTVGDTTITIKVERQYHTTVTQTVIARVRQVPIIKLLKPIFDSANLKKATLGGTVTQGSFPITTQTFEYRKLGSNDWTSLNAGTTNSTVTTYSQTVTDLVESTEYELRLSATDNQNNTVSETVLFKTQQIAPPTGAIEGEVDGGIGNITVTLEMGNTVVATITGLKNSDTFRFEKLPDGEYNLVATDGTYTVTKMATVKSGGTATLGLILIGSKQSVVKVENDAPPVAADGLNEIFDNDIYTSNAAATSAVNGGGTVEMRLTADKAKKKAEVDAINHIATDKKTVGMMIDLTVDMIITPYNGLSSVENITDTKALMEIAVPLPTEAQGKQNYQMLRYHNGNVDELTLLSTNAAPTAEGFRVKGAYAYILAQKFSTYAITYDKPSGGGESGGESGGGGSLISYYTITPTKSVGGQISPNKAVTVRGGNSAAFTMTPDKGYEIKEVKVDGKSVGAKAEYLFTNVWGNHTIAVSFKKATTSPSKPNPTPETKPSIAEDDLDKQKEDIKDDLISKRDDAIAALPDTPTGGQHQDAIDELNKICDNALEELDSAKSASEVSDILNNAIQAFSDVVEKVGGEVPTSKPTNTDGKEPFILLSALLALVAVLLAALTLFKKCTKKRKLIAIVGALLAVVIFLITTGWNGIAFANLWTVAVALATVIPVSIVIMKTKEEEKNAQEENPQ